MTPNEEGLFRAIEKSNPFLRNRVTEPGPANVDEPSIHRREYERILARISGVRTHRASTGILVVGAAGVGKSHLLSRIHHWAHDEREATAIFLHNVLASPARMPRYLLRATVSTLAGVPESYCESALYGLLNRAVKAALPKKGPKTPSIEDRLTALEEIGRAVDPYRRVMPALKRFVADATAATHEGDADAKTRAMAAVDWLSGELLEDDVAKALGVAPSIEDEDAVRHVFDVLGRTAAAAGHPFLIAIDQVDNLDDDKVLALASFLQALLDHCKNTVVLVSGVRESMDRLRETGAIPEAAWDRIAEHRVELARLGQDDARSLVRKRVQQVSASFDEIPKVRALRRKDPLFPLSTAWLERRLEDRIEVRARDVVTWAREAWEEEIARIQSKGGSAWLAEWPGGTRIVTTPPTGSDEVRTDRIASSKILESVAERQLRPETLPPDADNFATLAESLLGRCAGDRRYTLTNVAPSRKPAYDLLVAEQTEAGPATSGIVFLAATHGNEVTRALKRMLDDKEPPHHRYVVTDEDRRPLRLGPKGKDLFAALVALGKQRFEHVRLGFHDHAELDAFEGVLRTARTGDLEMEDGRGGVRPLREEEVAESLHRQGVFLKHPLLRHFLTEELPLPPLPSPTLPVDTKRARETILGQLSFRLCMTTRELAATYVELEHKGKKDIDLEHVRLQLVELADTMHKEGKLHATPLDDDRYVQLLHKKA